MKAPRVAVFLRQRRRVRRVEVRADAVHEDHNGDISVTRRGKAKAWFAADALAGWTIEKA